MGIVSFVRDWTLVKKQKQGFLEALKMTPAGGCISIKDPGNPITARAVIELLEENPNTLEAMDYGFEITLMRKVSMVNSMSTESYRTLRDNHNILSADSVSFFGLKNSDQLPMRRHRHGVDEKQVNGVTVDATEVNGQKVEAVDPASRIIKG